MGKSGLLTKVLLPLKVLVNPLNALEKNVHGANPTKRYNIKGVSDLIRDSFMPAENKTQITEMKIKALKIAQTTPK